MVHLCKAELFMTVHDCEIDTTHKMHGLRIPALPSLNMSYLRVPRKPVAEESFVVRRHQIAGHVERLVEKLKIGHIVADVRIGTERRPRCLRFADARDLRLPPANTHTNTNMQCSENQQNMIEIDKRNASSAECITF